MSGESEKIERLVKMAERLSEAVEADIAALESGQPRAMRTTNPEIQRLSALYGREAQGLSREVLENVPQTLQGSFVEATKKFRTLLSLHARMITRVRNASEGMIKAIAEEVDRQSAPLRPYSPPQSVHAHRTQAMIYNSVI